MLVVQPVPSVYVIVVVEGETGNTVPLEEPIVATPGALLVHVPPPVASVSAPVDPIHTFVDPDIAGGVAFTVIVVVIKHPVPNV